MFAGSWDSLAYSSVLSGVRDSTLTFVLTFS